MSLPDPDPPPDQDRFVMRRFQFTSLATLVLLGLVSACAPPASEAPAADPAADIAALQSLLEDFLARADEASAHERFWAEDVVYTSSTGTRRGKAEIMAGFQDSEPGDATEGEASPSSGPTYAGDQVDIRVYGDAAVVAFRLVISPPPDSGEPVSYNFNTGTFLKRDGIWKVVAWQSTRIPR